MTYQASKALIAPQLVALESTVGAMKAIGEALGFSAHGEAKLAIAAEMVKEAGRFQSAVLAAAEAFPADELRAMNWTQIEDRLFKCDSVKTTLPTAGEYAELLEQLDQVAQWQHRFAIFHHHKDEGPSFVSVEELEHDRRELQIDAFKALSQSFAHQSEAFYTLVCAAISDCLIEKWRGQCEGGQCGSENQCSGGVCQLR